MVMLSAKTESDVSVALPHRETTERSFDDLRHVVSRDLEAVDGVIVELLDNPVVLIPEIAGRLVSSGGKRIRPTLTLLAARMFGYQGDRHINLAACVEFIHTATLLHDDVIDDSALRRGEATANALWGNKPSVLVGDFLLSRAFRLMVEDGSLEILRILTDASAVIAEGEIRQLRIANDLATSFEDYMDVIQAKTATLFATACEVGAVIADRDEEARSALRLYGLRLGTAFQLVDDVLDYSALQQNLGKTIGDDFREGKITLPVVLALARGTPGERRFWERTLERAEQDDGDLEHAMDLLSRHNALQATMEESHRQSGLAAAAIGGLPDNEYRDTLLEMVDFCVNRQF